MDDIMPPKHVRRAYFAEFKTELVKASQQPSVSLAGLALHHGLNANILRRWGREYERLASFAFAKRMSQYIIIKHKTKSYGSN